MRSMTLARWAAASTTATAITIGSHGQRGDAAGRGGAPSGGLLEVRDAHRLRSVEVADRPRDAQQPIRSATREPLRFGEADEARRGLRRQTSEAPQDAAG